MSTLYNTIMRLCDEKGIKGGRMCTDIGMSKGILTDLKMGRQTGVSAANAKKIAAYFGVTVGYLLGEEETKKSPAEPMLNEGEKMLLDLFRQIPEDRQQVVIAMIKAALDRG
jgi:transcriptional regulator with XRE-family HTH domain